MDWRYRRYFAVRLPHGPYYYNEYMRLIKSVPSVKIHPFKYSQITNPDINVHSAFSDETYPRGYHNITVSVCGLENTKWLLAGLDMMCRDRWTGVYSYYKEILPRRKK